MTNPPPRDRKPPAHRTPRRIALPVALLLGCGADDASGIETSAGAMTQAPAGSSTEASASELTGETSASGTTGASPQSLEAWFEEAGFVVQAGAASSFVLQDCVALTNCFGNNASAPYLLFSLPPHPDLPGEIPPSVVGDIPKVPAGMSAAWFLESNEAVVIVGRTPPTAKYYGLTPYVFTRALSDTERYTPFASLSDTLNPVTTRTASGESFDAEFSVILAGDSTVRAATAEALSNAGYSEAGVNDLVFSPEQVRFGLDAGADQLMLMGRVAVIEDATAAEAYLQSPPVEVWRLTFQGNPDEAEPAPLRAPRGDGVDEHAYAEGLDALELAIEASLDGASYNSISIASSQLVSLALDPEQCLASSGECLGDNSDTTYAVGPLEVAAGDGVLTLGPDEAFIVFGVNHAVTGKATYSNMSVYAQAKGAGVVGLTDDEMRGSAERFLPDHPDRDALWAYELRRDCGGKPDCLELPTDFPGATASENIFFIFRAYLQPGSTVSAGHDEILTERVIKVSAPSAPR